MGSHIVIDGVCCVPVIHLQLQEKSQPEKPVQLSLLGLGLYSSGSLIIKIKASVGLWYNMAIEQVSAKGSA